jgi:hypothetical protein
VTKNKNVRLFHQRSAEFFPGFKKRTFYQNAVKCFSLLGLLHQ